MKSKKLLDTVHGYISVPEEFCTKLIDTVFFQRLRRIEQTSARSLFPCAHHDRFVHSLGVFHIGQRIVDSVSKQNIEINTGIKTSYLIACLLHDCGHSPFSHTLEHLFGTTQDLFKVYIKTLKKRNIDKELWNYDINKSDAKQHEIISAYMCQTVFYEKIQELGGNPAFVCRMIMGILYEDKNKSIENCFISLLHGDIIDADKLDYVCRDKWAAGYLSQSVDLDRLISSILIKQVDGVYKIQYRKNAINEIQAVIDSKNFQYMYVFTHHQVVYEQMLLLESVKELIKALNNVNNPSAIFDYRSYIKPQKKNGITIYLLCDDDIVHLMKTHSKQIPHFEEWFSREYRYFPLWKTRSEFIALFDPKASNKLLEHGEIFEKTIKPAIHGYNESCKCIILDGNPKLKTIERGQIEIAFDQSTADFVNLSLPNVKDLYKGKVFKYVFIPIKFYEERSKILEVIRKALNEKYKKNGGGKI